MSLPRKSLVIVSDRNDPSREMAYWAEMQRSTYRKQGFRYWGLLAVVFGLAVMFWMEVVK